MTPAEQSALEAARDTVDTWPDWKLDTSTLHERNARRERGESLPKPTKLAVFVEDQAKEIGRLREENARLTQLSQERHTSMHWLTVEIDRLKEEISALKAPEYSRPQQGQPNCRVNGVVIR